MSNNKTGLRHAMINSDTLAGEFCEILTLDAIFGDLVQCEGGLPMPFEANVPNPSTGEMLGVAEGVGGLTEGASTSILVPDYQGVYKEVLANNPAWEGARWDGDVAYAESGYPLPRLVYAPEATNLQPDSRDYTQWTNDNATISSATGIDGAIVNCSITDTSTNGFHSVRQVFSRTASTIFSYVLWIKKSGIGILGVQVTAPATPNSFLLFDPLDGSWGHPDGFQGVFTGVAVKSEGDFWKLGIEVSTLQTSVTTNIYPAAAATVAGPLDDTQTGTQIVDSVCVWDNTPLDAAMTLPPIFTAGAPVTRTARALSFDGANHDPDQSGYYLEWEPSMLPTGESGNWGILTFDGASTNTFYHHDGATPLRIRQWYGANTSRNLDDGLGGGVVHPSAFVIDTDEADSLSAWDNDAGDWTVPLASSGSPAVSTINLGQGSPYVIKFGPIRRYQAPLEEMKAQLEADIAAGEAA